MAYIIKCEYNGLGDCTWLKAIAVDMDGTFLDSKKNYDKDRFEKIFKALKERNIEFIAASGNQFAKLQSIFGERDMFFISENGAVIYRGKDLYNYRSFNQVEYKEVRLFKYR